ncbi:MAG: nucleoid-associated protein [Sphingobacteriales bacterium]|nr:MAG: nucleoid-associated protein [Sphingobacteriales bacterium]
MIFSFNALLSRLSIHHIGNKLQDENLSLSQAPTHLQDAELSNLLLQYFLNAFQKVNEVYRFYHSSNDLELNPVYNFAAAVFEDNGKFHSKSELIAKHLYDISNHPKIKSGELYVVYFNSVQIEGELFDAIGIFKSETKETYLKVLNNANVFDLIYEQDAININKLDKGCLIFNTEKEEGYKVAVLDQTNRSSEAVYWKDDFLKLKIRNDNYNQTQNVLGVYKNFVTQKLDTEFDLTKADKIDLLNKSIKYFKENETFDLNEFADEVIGNEKGISSFKDFKLDFETEFETPIADTFDISSAAVKKQSKNYKSVLKLDKNFHIYIHGDRQLIEQGTDTDGRKFYKIYYKDES